ncbi:MAG: hypothetical protein VYD19_10105 [Myxococcota bacterium]|nr:hypothetical protein [Myxococcota bacterium]
MSVELTETSFRLHNFGPTTLLDLRIGDKEKLILRAGEVWEGESVPRKQLNGETEPLQLDGRYLLEEWGAALKELPTGTKEDPDAPLPEGRRAIAHLHLLTVGLHTNQGAFDEAPQATAAVAALKDATPKQSASWAEGGHLQAALAAYAARYVPPGELLDQLLTKYSPNRETKLWSGAWQALPSIERSIRAAIEAHGERALPILLKHSRWSDDRGFNEVDLAFALHEDDEILLKAIGSREDTTMRRLENRFIEEKRLCDQRGIEAPEATLRKLISLQGQDEAQAISLSVRAALMWQRHNIVPGPSQVSQLVCGHLDLGAQRSINEKRLLAAEAYLNLGQSLCHGIAFYRARAAEYMRERGDQSYYAHDLFDAEQWYRGAYWLGVEAADRARLADTLARLAIESLTRAELRTGRDYLREAQRLEPFRETVLAVSEYFPRQTDFRAQLGIIFICLCLGLFVFKRIFDLFSRPKRSQA